jgi:hypothetical protein
MYKLLIILLIWSSAANTQIINASRYYVPLSKPKLLLDSFPSAASAYSLRKLRNTYNGSCIRIRRSSDNSEFDIGFVNNYVDTNAIKSYVTLSSQTAYVSKWYDQSGNGYDAVQAIANRQPYLNNSAGFIYKNGFVQVYFYSNSNNPSNVGLSAFQFASPSTNWYYEQVFFSDANNGNHISGSDGQGYNANGLYIDGSSFIFNGSGKNVFISGGLYANNGTLANTSIQVFSNNYCTAFYNGSTGAYTSISLGGNPFTKGAYNSWYIGNYPNDSHYSMIGGISEEIAWLSDQSTNRSTIQANVNNFYKIY